MTIKYTMTTNNITIYVGGEIVSVDRSDPNFKALVETVKCSEQTGDWNTLKDALTVDAALDQWSNGKFRLSGDEVLFNGKAMPGNIAGRVKRLLSEGSDPSPVFKFWERLSKNPSYRSVNQLFDFLDHGDIPLTDEGMLLAYKSVTSDFKDHHTNSVDNSIGTTNEMPRNEISDDPELACHVGFHVGSFSYACDFYRGSPVIICRVDPEDVVCVPKDAEAQKMRVCRYQVIGNSSGKMTDDVILASDIPVHATKEQDVDNNLWDDQHNMSTKDLMGLAIKDLRTYATHGLCIVGASKIPGGKTALINKIKREQRRL